MGDESDYQITLPQGYVYANRADEGGVTSVRCNLSSSKEWHDWRQKFETSACQKFIVKHTRNKVVRYAFGQDLVCQHSNRNKVVSEDGQRSSRCTGCEASLSVKIKHVNRNTRRNDPFLKQDPPLPATISFSLEHNHQTQCADALRVLRVSDETRSRFMEYFNNGLSPAAAMSFHESWLLSEAKHDLANAALNPTSRTVYYLHDIWRQENFASPNDPPVKLDEKPDYCHNSGVVVAAVKETTRQELSRIAQLITSHSLSAVSALLPCLQSIKTEEDLLQAAHQCQSAMRARRGGTIKVLPTSIARRRAGLTRGLKRVASGRPPLIAGASVQHPRKKPRLLIANVKRNVPQGPHAKSHGLEH